MVVDLTFQYYLAKCGFNDEEEFLWGVVRFLNIG